MLGGSWPEAGENRYVRWPWELILLGSDLREVIFQAMFYVSRSCCLARDGSIRPRRTRNRSSQTVRERYSSRNSHLEEGRNE